MKNGTNYPINSQREFNQDEVKEATNYKFQSNFNLNDAGKQNDFNQEMANQMKETQDVKADVSFSQQQNEHINIDSPIEISNQTIEPKDTKINLNKFYDGNTYNIVEDNFNQVIQTSNDYQLIGPTGNDNEDIKNEIIAIDKIIPENETRNIEDNYNLFNDDIIENNNIDDSNKNKIDHPNKEENQNINIQSNNNKQEDKNVENLKLQLQSLLSNAREFSYRNDPESQEFFRDKIPSYIFQLLQQNMLHVHLSNESLKVIFLFFIRYIDIRIEFLDEMVQQELYAILKIIDQYNQFYINYNNSNVNSSYTNEYFTKIISEILPQEKFLNNHIFASNWNVRSNPNTFFKIIMIYLEENDYFTKFISFLRKPFLDLEVFYNTYITLCKLIYLYQVFNSEIIIKLIRAINDYYKNNLFENQKIKELQKYHYETIVKSHIFHTFQLTLSFMKPEKSLNDIPFELRELNLIDLDIIHILLVTNNLEKRVIGVRSLGDIILLIIQNEKQSPENLKGFSEPQEFLRMIYYKKNLLLEWLEKIKIFDIIFGENIHEAILKKSSSILIFLYINQKLPFEKIDFIWKMAQEKHEAISASIQSIFSDLISYLSLDHVMHILKIINEIQFKELNDVTLKILESISNNKYLIDHEKNDAKKNQDNNNVNQNNKKNPQNKEENFKIGENNENLINQMGNFNKSENANEADDNILDFILIDNQNPTNLEQKEIILFKSFYLKILWKLVSDVSYYDGLSPTIIQKSRKIFCNILLKPVFKAELFKYIKKSIINIGLNHRLNTNLNILDILLKNIKNYLSSNKNLKNNNQNNIYPQENDTNCEANILSCFSNDIKDFNGLISYLEKNFQISSTIFHAIVSVKKETMNLADEIIGIQEKVNLNITKEIFTDENNQKQNSIKLSILQEIICHYDEQISHINKHKIDKNSNLLNNFNNLNSYINLKNSNSKNVIENEMEIELDDNDNLKINSNLNINKSKKSDKNRDIKIPQNEGIINQNYIQQKITKDEFNIENIIYRSDNNYKKSENNDINQDIIIDNNNNILNMDETLSTEKSFDQSISSYSTDISSLNLTKNYILKEFLEKNLKSFSENVSFLDNYEMIFQRIKLNFQNNNYYQILENLLEFLKFIIFSSNIQITQQQIDYLYVLLIENSISENEMNIFFNFFAEIFRFQQLTKQNFISDENLNYLLFDILLKLEFSEIPASGFNLFKQIFYYINTLHNIIKITSQNITDIKNFKNILAFETLWKFYIDSNNPIVLNEAKKLLVNLITTITKNEDNAESLIIIFQKVFYDLENMLANLLNNIDDTNNIIINSCTNFNDNMFFKENFDKNEISDEKMKSENEDNLNNQEKDLLYKNSEEKAIRLIKLLSTLNSKQKIDKPKNAELVTVNFHNSYFKDIKKQSMSLPHDMKLKELKQLIINKILCPNNLSGNNINDNLNVNMNLVNEYKNIIDENSILLLYKGKILNNDKFTLKDYKFENNGIVNIHKGENYSTEYEVDENTLKEYINQIKFVMEFDDEIIKRALKKNTYKIEDTIIYLTDEGNIASIQTEIQDENLFAMNEIENKLNIEIFKEKEVRMLLGFLNLHYDHLSKEIWELLANIRYPANLISCLIDSESIQFKNIFSVNDLNLTLFNLKLINCLIFNDKFFSNIIKIDDNKKLEWKMNLISSEGIDCMINFLFDCVEKLEKIESVKSEIKLENDVEKRINTNIIHVLYQIIQILSKWTHYLTMCASLTISNIKDNLNFVIKQMIQNRPVGLKVGVEQNLNQTQSQINSSKDSSPSQTTPTFGSPHSSFSEGVKSVSMKQKGHLQVGLVDENDNFLDEDGAHKYFSKLIYSNFHLCMEKFFFISKRHKQIFELLHENENIYLNFLEILVIYNEMNPVAFKEFLIKETNNSMIIDLLFKEKSKNIRKLVENIFNMLIQNKPNENINIKISNHDCKSTKEVIMIHIFNNYKKIFSDQVYEEFFNLFGSILSYDRELISSFFEESKLNELSLHIIDTIRCLSEKNDIDLNDSEQEKLSGNIYLFQCLCLNYENVILPILDKIEDFNIINFFYKNLFTIENEFSTNTALNHVRFKYSQSSLRQKTYDLLISFIKFKEVFKKSLGEKLLTHHTNFSNDYLERFDINIDLRSTKDKFIGLQNYGCTCYLNSLIQQLYMIPQFRHSLFKINFNKTDKIPEDMEGVEMYFDQASFSTNRLQKYKEKENYENNPVYQLQNLFANLSYSIKQYHSPMSFITSFKGFNNEPINVRIQQDCEEFLNILVDRLENYTKNFTEKDIFDDSFRGKISYEIVSLEKEYSYYSETENPFLAISLDIKNKRTIEEALDLYVRGEVLEGENKYLVEKYNKKISILRRCSIKKLSKTVIIHLKRFEFDYNTFDKIKIIDYCQFPDFIDFKPWMRSTIIAKNKEDPNYKDIEIDENELNDTESFKYQLTGILVHSGSTADGGHYYSIIFDYLSNKWYKFDDSRISEFNIENLKNECYGEDKENADIFTSRSQTAYLLFYTKISERNNIINTLNNMDSEIPKTIIEQIKYENSLFLKYKTYLDNDYFKFIRDYIDFTVLKNKTTEKLSKKEQSMSLQDFIDEEVNNELMSKLNENPNIVNLDYNNQLQMEYLKKIYHEIYNEVELKIKSAKSDNSKKIYDKITQQKSPANLDLKKKIIKLSIYFYFEIIVQQKDSYKINSYSNFIRELIETDKRIACWFLKKMIKQKNYFIKMILEHSSSEVRESMSRIVLNCILSLYNEESKYIKEQFNKILITENDNKINIQQVKVYKSCVMRFFKNNIIEEFDFIRINWSRFTQFLYIINECFNSLLFELLELSINNNLFQKIILMIMNNSPGYNTNFPTMGTKNIEVNISLLLEILSTIIQSCITTAIINKKRYSEVSKYQGNKNIIEIPKNWEIILNKEILGNTILRKYTSENIIKMLRHLSWGDERISIMIINIITSTIKDNLRDIKALNNLLNNSNGVFLVDDENKIKRINHYFCLDEKMENDNDSVFNYLLSIKDDLPLNCLFCLNLIGILILKYPLIMNYFLKYANNLIWIFYFLKDISTNQAKQDNLQIEASTENINYVECFSFVDDLYLEKLKIKRMTNNNQNMDIYERDYGVDSYLDFQQGIEMNTKIKNSNNDNNDFNSDPPF